MKEEEKQFDKQSIGELELCVRNNLSASKNSIIEATKVLRYLQVKKRYKENKRYAKETFDSYLEDLFGVRMGTFREWVRSLPFEAEAKIFGIGLVAKTLRQCGPINAKKAFNEIVKLEEVRKEKSIPKEKIDEIIVKNRDPRRMAVYEKKIITDWKSMYEREREAHETTKMKLMEAHERIKELEDQVSRLKGTAVVFDQVRDIFENKFKQDSQVARI